MSLCVHFSESAPLKPIPLMKLSVLMVLGGAGGERLMETNETILLADAFRVVVVVFFPETGGGGGWTWKSQATGGL